MTTKGSSLSVDAKDKGKRVDALLASFYPEYSRNYFQSLIAKKGVFVNGEPIMKDYRMRGGDTIQVRFEVPEKLDFTPDPHVSFRVVHDEEGFAVIDKPAGMVVHPSLTHKKGTLVNGLLAKWPEISKVGDPVTGTRQENFRPGIVHRLDKDTSGLMVIAKTQPLFIWLKKQYQGRSVEKRYNALVYGVPTRGQGEIDIPIARVGQKQVAVNRMNNRVSGKAGKSRNARTGFKIMASYGDFSLIEATPHTGRMHQIRVHLAHLGHPVVGDKKYATRHQLRKLPVERHFLHAGYLAFLLPDGRKAEFTSPLPTDLKQILHGLEKEGSI